MKWTRILLTVSFYRLEHEKQTLKQRLSSQEDELGVASTPHTDVVTHADPSSEVLNQYPMFVGKYNYDNHTDDDLSFRKGDLMYIINTDDED